MKILLIEDDAHKADRIIHFLYSNYEYSELDLAKSVQEGIEKLKASSPSIILLDMSLPVFAYDSREQGFMHNSYAGEDILEHLDNFDIEIPVIVITAFDRFGDEKNAYTLEQLNNKLKFNYSNNYLGAVSYNPIDNDWQRELLNFISISFP